MSLTSWLFAIHENGRLKADLAARDSRIEELEQRLFEEIEADRNHSAAMTQTIAEVAGASFNAQARAKERPDEPDKQIPTLNYDDGPTPEEIEFVVDQYVENAAKTGGYYSEEQKATLRERIKAYPEQYMP